VCRATYHPQDGCIFSVDGDTITSTFMIQTRTRRHVCFVTIVEGDLTTPHRERCESTFFTRLSAARIAVSMVGVNDEGCALAVDEYDLDGLRKAAQQLNIALRVRTHCARILITEPGVDPPLPPVSSVLAAMAEAEIGVIHLATGSDGLAILVDERDAARAQTVFVDFAVPTPQSAA
jgi:aspartokinase